MAMDMSLSRAYGTGAVAFSPLSLSPTAWYDPSDMTTLFQDSAGATPVTATGQPVGRMLDKSGNGHHLIQATAGSRPTYTEGGGFKYLVFDGAGDEMAVASIAITQSNSVALAFEQTVASGNVIDASGARQIVSNSGAQISMFAGAAQPNMAAAALNTPYVANCLFDGASSNVRLNGTVSANQNPGTDGLSALVVGRFNFNGRLHGLIIRDAPFDATDRATIDTYLGGKCGVVV